MASAVISDFLDSSTIHGLRHITTSKSLVGRVAWVSIVVACFTIAISMISNSYKEWQDSPVSTTITTHPITELEFPDVTVCPPRGSNTAVNHLLEKVKDVNFTEEERTTLLNISREVFLETPNKKHARQMAELLSFENMRSIVNGQTSVPKVDNNGIISIETSELEGSFQTPGFADPDYDGEFYTRAQSLLYVLDLPDKIAEIVGEGVLIVSVETKGNWSFVSPDSRLELHKENLSFSEAEDLCVRKGGHLASVGSQRENYEIFRLASGKRVGLGGRRVAEADHWEQAGEGWQWSDGRSWNYTNWRRGPGANKAIIWGHNMGRDCLFMSSWGFWEAGDCYTASKYHICANPPSRRLGNHTLVTRKHSLRNVRNFQFWWNHTIDDMAIGMPGFRLTWHIENGNFPDLGESVSRDLSGRISTPGLDPSSPPSPKTRREYSYKF